MTIVPIEHIKCATFPTKKAIHEIHYNNNGIATVCTCGMEKQEKEEIAEDGIAAEGMGKMQRPKHPTSYFETLVHLLKGNIASGMLAMGDAYKNAGLLFASFLTVTLGVICVFNQHVLINCANLMRETNKLDYYPGFDDTMKLCFEAGPPVFKKYAKLAKFFVNFFIVTAQLGFCCVYFVFISSTTKQILDLYGYEIGIHLHMIGVLVCLAGFVLIRNLKFMVPVSFIAMIIMFIGVAMTLYISSQDLPSPSTRTWFASISTLPLFFGTAIYAFEGISLVLPLQVEMKHPEKFNSPLGVLNFGMFITTILLITVGTIGYLKYGEDIKGSITLNLPPAEVLSQCIKLAIGISIMLTYPLMFYIPFTLLWQQVNKRWGPFNKPLFYEHTLRLLLVFMTFVLAEAIPNLGLFISLVGAVSSTALALVFPPLCDISVRWYSSFGRFYWRLFVDIITLILAVFVFITGTYYSVTAIVSAYFDNSIASNSR